MGKLTDEVKADILRRLHEGQSLRSACAANSLSHCTWCDAVRDDADLSNQYARARDNGIDSQAEEMHDLEMRVLSGELDANAFRAAMDARKWRLARQAPRKYGDKVQQEISGGDKPVSVVFKWKE
jgi:hypothetical protein